MGHPTTVHGKLSCVSALAAHNQCTSREAAHNAAYEQPTNSPYAGVIKRKVDGRHQFFFASNSMRERVEGQGPPTVLEHHTGVLVKENAGLGSFLHLPLADF